MHISWLGTTALKIQTKPHIDDVTVIIDPYKPEEGTFPKSLTANIVLYTRGEEHTIPISGEPFIVKTPGEIETKHVLITSVQGHTPNHIIVRIDSEQMSLAHLGMTTQELTDEQLDTISGVDIVCLPVGGGDGYEADKAVKIINAIEPRIVIPLAYKSDNDPNNKDISLFMKAIGMGQQEPEKKYIIKKKDLPQDETKVIILTKE